MKNAKRIAKNVNWIMANINAQLANLLSVTKTITVSYIVIQDIIQKIKSAFNVQKNLIAKNVYPHKKIFIVQLVMEIYF